MDPALYFYSHSFISTTAILGKSRIETPFKAVEEEVARSRKIPLKVIFIENE